MGRSIFKDNPIKWRELFTVLPYSSQWSGSLHSLFFAAMIFQLGERQTLDLKVVGSILTLGEVFCP